MRRVQHRSRPSSIGQPTAKRPEESRRVQFEEQLVALRRVAGADTDLERARGSLQRTSQRIALARAKAYIADDPYEDVSTKELERDLCGNTCRGEAEIPLHASSRPPLQRRSHEECEARNQERVFRRTSEQ